MKVGFTGTRKGMSETQKKQFRYVLALVRDAEGDDRKIEFHHGGADGADKEAAKIARLEWCEIYVHPCHGVVRDSQDPYINDRWLEVFPPLQRNRHIVEAADMLIAAPEIDKEELRSDTWATVRYARKKGIPVVMLSRGDV